MNIPFSPPYIDASVEAEVLDSLRSGWITSGPKVQALERAVEAYMGIDACACVNSWTSGAIMMLRWFGIGAGDEVIVPAYTYAATALAVLHAGATPVMVDVTEDFIMDPSKVEAAITGKTKAILPVDIGGWPADYEAIRALCESNSAKFVARTEIQKKLGRILIISDAAHSFGAITNGQKFNPFADVVIYSFHAVKNLTTAEGGAICLNLPAPFNNIELKPLIKRYALNGQTKDALAKSQAGSWRYDIVELGFKYNMPDVCAAIGLAQIGNYDELLQKRAAVFKHYQTCFKLHEWAIPPAYKNETKESSYHLYMLRIKDITEDQRDAIISTISANGVSVNVHFIPMPMLTLFKSMGYRINDYPSTYQNYACEISLPIYPQLTEVELEYICKTVIEAVKKITK